MKDLFNKMEQLAKDAADKTNDLVEIGKLKSQIATAKSDINIAEKKIGQYYYQKASEGAELPEEVAALCNTIREQNALIFEMEKKIADLS